MSRIYEQQLEEQNSQLQELLAVAENQLANQDRRRVLIIEPQDGVVDFMKIYLPILQFVDLVLVRKEGQFFESIKDGYNKTGTLYTMDEVRKMYD